jgi:hypothetical protein
MKFSYSKSIIKNLKILLVLASFIFVLFANFASFNIPCVWTGIEKIIGVGDLHGDFKNFVIILKATKVVDEKLHWIGGKTHLVQTGDIMDRGPDAKKIFDLLIKLEKEAEKAGGKVHMLIGNHEEMNITGIAFDYIGYITVEQFVSFLPNKYREKKEKEFREKAANKASTDIGSIKLLNTNLREYWKDIIANNEQARKTYINHFNEEYGKWILEHNSVIKINDIIFVHGGISEEYSTWKLDDINNLLRNELNYFRKMHKSSQYLETTLQPKIVYNRSGPLWYRGLALEDEKIYKDEVSRILHNLSAHYMVIAHSVVSTKVISADTLSRFQGRIWTIDTGISDIYGGNLSALIIEHGKFTTWSENNED